MLLMLFVHLTYYFVSGAYLKRQFWVEFLDVGHGDAATIHLPTGQVLLVDGGGFAHSSLDLGKKVWIPYFRNRRIQKIDVLMVTHPHPDHYKGFETILGKIPIKSFWYNGIQNSSKEWQIFFNKIDQSGILIEKINQNTSKKKMGIAEIQFFNLNEEITEPKQSQSGKVVNNQSLVFLLSIYDQSVLFTGDIEKETEEAIQDKLEKTNVTLLKVPHHGSKTSSSKGFLDALRPKMAIASAGTLGRHIFPHPLVLNRYKSLGIPLFTTKDCGALRFQVKKDGSYNLRSYNGMCNLDFPSIN